MKRFISSINTRLQDVNLVSVKRVLMFNTVFLILAHLIGRFFFGVDDENGLFNLDVERNIPTVYTTLLLTISGILLLIIGLNTYMKKRKFSLNWIVLGIIFIYLGFDEYLSIHEKWMEPIRESLNTTGILYFAWIIPYFVAIVILGLLYIKFFLSLPKKTRIQFILAGIIYLLGALVIEAFGGMYIESVDWQKDLTYFIIISFEESLELIGMSFFVYVLLNYNKNKLPKS